MNRSKPIIQKIVLGIILTVCSTAGVTMAKDAPDVKDIIHKANLAAYYAGDDGRAEVKMTIKDAQGRTRERKFVILRRDVTEGAAQQFYVYFKRPSDVRKMVFMVHKNIDRDDDRWLYLPALDLVKRIAATDKRTSFVGSNFYYEDVSGRAIADDTHELLETTDAHYIIKSTPKNPDSVEFSSYTVWIDKETYMPLKAEYIDKEGQKYRLVEAMQTTLIQGFPTVTKSRVKDLVGGGETISEFSKIKYNNGLPEKIFSERYLRKPPREARR